MSFLKTYHTVYKYWINQSNTTTYKYLNLNPVHTYAITQNWDLPIKSSNISIKKAHTHKSLDILIMYTIKTAKTDNSRLYLWYEKLTYKKCNKQFYTRMY